MGQHVHNQQLVAHSSTDKDLLEKLEFSAGQHLEKCGFTKWVWHMRKQLVDCGGCANASPDGSKTPWMTMSVSTVNHGNKDHVNGGDHCKGIGAWHESNPLGISKPRNRDNQGWFFCFPNIEVHTDGVWKKGVAVCLQHGTVVGWDSQCIQHCTLLPSLRVSTQMTLQATAMGLGLESTDT